MLVRCWIRVKRCRVMAHDSNPDGWDLRQGDLPAGSFCRNDLRSVTIAGYDFPIGESKQRETYQALSNGYPQLQHRTRAIRSCSDVCIINPAIHAEPSDSRQHPVIEANCGDSSTFVGNLSSLSISGDNVLNNSGDPQTGQNTYRCLPLASSTTPSTIFSSRANSKSSIKIRCCTLGKTSDDDLKNLSDQPEIQKYALNGRKVIECSSSSLSCLNLSECQGSSSRISNDGKNAYEEWVEKKKVMELRRKEKARRLEQEKKAEEERLEKEREDRERKDRENFLHWSERKRKEEASKREAFEKGIKELASRLKEVEEKSDLVKTICLRQWSRKKEDQQKVLQRKQELRQKREDQERKRRLDESSKAYEKWRETSKNRPRPATQGLLPEHKAKPSYINPNPWVVDIVESTESQENPSSADTKKQ